MSRAVEQGRILDTTALLRHHVGSAIMVVTDGTCLADKASTAIPVAKRFCRVANPAMQDVRQERGSRLCRPLNIHSAIARYRRRGSEIDSSDVPTLRTR